jgi:hypothetical protein
VSSAPAAPRSGAAGRLASGVSIGSAPLSQSSGVSRLLNGLADGKLGVTRGALDVRTVVWLVPSARALGPLARAASDEGVNLVFSPGW